MRAGFALVITLFAATCLGQQPNAAPIPPSSATSATETHQAAVDFISALGLRQQIVANLDKMVSAGKDEMAKQTPTPSPAFVEEWGKRMKARLNPDDFVTIAVRVYEAHFTAAELKELIVAQKAINAAQTPELSPALKDKFSKDFTTIQSEMMGGFSQVGSKLGGDIGMELQKEHPEWFPAPTAAQGKP